jgi:hypothetical protein
LLDFQKGNLAKVNSRTVCMSSERKPQLDVYIPAPHFADQRSTYDVLIGIVGEALYFYFVNHGVSPHV